MGFRDLFRGRNNETAANQDRAKEVKAEWKEERQTFLDGLKVDVPQTAYRTENATVPAASSQDDGRERGDDMTHTRSDSLKGGSNVQEAMAAAEESAGMEPAEQDGTANAADDSMDDSDGLSL